MASPDNMRTGPSSPEERPGIGRAFTAPELAAAIEQSRAQPKHRNRPGETSGSSSDLSTADKLNDLGPERTSEFEDSQIESTPIPHHFFRRRPKLPSLPALQTYFFQEVAGDKYLEFQLLLMTISTGMLDAMTFTTYRVFASKQTGNTLFLALYALRLPAIDPGVEQNVGVSMGVFIAGAIFFGHLGHWSRQRLRIWLLASNAFQALLFLGAAAIRYFVSRSGTGSGALAILTLLSFAESGQIANALNVAMPELNTTMITGALIQLCTDKKFFHLKNAKRNRRLAFFCSMLLGCFLGASILRFSSPSACLVVTAATKGLIFFLFFFNRGLVEKKWRLEDGKERVEGAVTPASRVLWGD